MQDTRPHISRTAWTLADQAVVSLGNFLINIQLARHLAASEYGVFALMFSVVFLFQHCCIAALFYPMSLRVAAAAERREDALMSVTILIVAVCNLAFAVVLAGIMLVAGRGDMALAAAIFSFLWLTQDVMRRGLMAEFRHREAMIGDSVAYFGQAAVVAYLMQKGLLTLPGALVLMGVACAFGGLMQLVRLRLPRPELAGTAKLLREFWQIGRWAVTSGVLMHLRLQLFPWALGLVHGPAATAAYQAMMNVSNLTNPVVFGLCNTISQAAAQAKASGGNAAAWKTAKSYVWIGAPFVLIYVVAVFAVPGLVLRLFYGAQSPYLDYELPLRLIMIALAVSSIAEAYSAFLYGVADGKKAFNISLVGLGAAVAAGVMIGPWAVTGAAVGMLLANVARLVSSFLSLSTVTSDPIPGSLQRLGATAGSTAGTTAGTTAGSGAPIRVTIVTPVLNGGALFSQCIESVIRERDAERAKGSGIEVEHIIADGGSTDGSIALAQSYGIDVVQENGTDLHERINRAYFASKGELIGFLGADDILLEGAIERIVAGYRQSGRRWVVGSLKWIDPDGRSLGTIKAPPYWLKPEIHACLGWNFCPPMTTYFSHSFFKELGGFDGRFKISADYDLFTRALVAAPFARVGVAVAGSRRSGRNMSALKKGLIAEENHRILERYGPPTLVGRVAAWVLLKSWINVCHPVWLVNKLWDRAKVRLGLKETRYFD